MFITGLVFAAGCGLKIKDTKRTPKSHLKRPKTSQKIDNKLRWNALWARLSAV